VTRAAFPAIKSRDITVTSSMALLSAIRLMQIAAGRMTFQLRVIAAGLWQCSAGRGRAGPWGRELGWGALDCVKCDGEEIVLSGVEWQAVTLLGTLLGGDLHIFLMHVSQLQLIPRTNILINLVRRVARGGLGGLAAPPQSLGAWNLYCN